MRLFFTIGSLATIPARSLPDSAAVGQAVDQAARMRLPGDQLDLGGRHLGHCGCCRRRTSVRYLPDTWRARGFPGVRVTPHHRRTIPAVPRTVATEGDMRWCDASAAQGGQPPVPQAHDPGRVARSRSRPGWPLPRACRRRRQVAGQHRRGHRADNPVLRLAGHGRIDHRRVIRRSINHRRINHQRINHRRIDAVPDSACGQPELGAFKPACLPRPAPQDSRYPAPPSSAVPPGTVEPATAAFPVGLLAGIPAKRCRAAGSRPD
jgi:hypothetical protein